MSNINDMQAVELEREMLNRSFRRFQEKNQEHLAEMTTNICKRCGDCKDVPNPACGLTASMVWHVFSIYFTAVSGIN